MPRRLHGLWMQAELSWLDHFLWGLGKSLWLYRPLLVHWEMELGFESSMITGPGVQLDCYGNQNPTQVLI